VYAVRDLPLERDLAVKVLHTPRMELLVRFGREAKILGKLRHPNIVPVHFVGAGEGLPYMVMPLIVGENLRALIRRHRRLRVDMALEIAIAVCSALQAAHDAGIVHRDVKPDNILLEGKERRVQVMDFGIAKILEKQTSVGTLIGTAEYMSPEQFTQDPQIDGRSDVYAMGCVVYEMLVGRPPFLDAGGGFPALLLQHLTVQPESPRSYRGDVPPTVEGYILKALAKNPSDRFNSADDFRVALLDSLEQLRHSKKWWDIFS